MKEVVDLIELTKKKEVQECPTCHVFWNIAGWSIVSHVRAVGEYK